MRLLERIFGCKRPVRADIAYATAMRVSDDFIRRMQEMSGSKDAARAVMADIWAQNHNVPFITTIVETVEEMKSGIYQRPSDR
jgi:hypothetical protein